MATARPALLEDSGIYSGRVSPWLTAPGDNQRTWGYPSKPQVTDLTLGECVSKYDFLKGLGLYILVDKLRYKMV